MTGKFRYIPFNRILVISGQWEGDKERLSALETCVFSQIKIASSRSQSQTTELPGLLPCLELGVKSLNLYTESASGLVKMFSKLVFEFGGLT